MEIHEVFLYGMRLALRELIHLTVVTSDTLIHTAATAADPICFIDGSAEDRLSDRMWAWESIKDNVWWEKRYTILSDLTINELLL